MALAEETGWYLSLTEIGRILRTADLRPHRMRLWLHSPDPDFRAKVEAVCRVYTDPPAGAAVLCVDEKTCIQARAGYLEHPRGIVLESPVAGSSTGYAFCGPTER